MVYFRKLKHSYFNDKGETYLSVTTFLKRFKEDYDEEYWLSYKALEAVRNNFQIDPETGKYAKMPGFYRSVVKYPDIRHAVKPSEQFLFDQTRLELKNSWEDNRVKATDFGTSYHKMNEDRDNNNGEVINPNNGLIYPVVPVVNCPEDNCSKLGYDDGCHLELLIHSDKHMIAGQSDKVFFMDNLFDIRDFKTNDKLATESFNHKKMKYPFNTLDDCVSGDTKLITRNGIVTIKDVIGKSINIWNGEKWSLVSPFQTGTNKELYKITFSDGSTLNSTLNHKFLIKYRLDGGFMEQSLEDIINVMSKTKWIPRLPHCNIIYKGGKNVNEAYDWGFILGDGTIYDNVVRAELHGSDKKLNFTNVKRINQYQSATVAYFDLNSTFGKKLKYNQGLPKEIFSWNKESILKFIAGWLDADGTNHVKGVVLYGREDKLRDAQLLLTKCNIRSSLTKHSSEGEITNLGVRKNGVWRLHISKTIDIPSQRLKCDSQSCFTKQNKWQSIISIEKIDGVHNTFCLTEKDHNVCVFNNVLTKQCTINHYAIQLGLYAYMLELQGYECRGLFIDHYEKPIEVKYYKEMIEEAMKIREIELSLS